MKKNNNSKNNIKITDANIEITYFSTIKKCIHLIDKSAGLYLFGEDKYEYNNSSKLEGKKVYCCINYETAHLLSVTKERSLYEYFNMSDNIKLFLDISVPYKDIPSEDDINTKANMCINIVKDHLKIHNVINSQIVVLKACKKEELFLRIIFIDVHFVSITKIKQFMDLINKKNTTKNEY